MRSKRATLRTLSISSAAPQTLLRVIEPFEIDRRVLLRQIHMGIYQRPFLIENGHERSLEFHLNEGSQSAMRCGDPDELIVPYTREMMAFLLSCPSPRHVVMAGLGGGSLVKYCYRNLPETRITAIEINPWVISLRDEFRIPEDDERLSIVCADARNYFANPGDPADAVLIDLYDRRGGVAFLRDREFLIHVKSHLTEKGCVVLNVLGPSAWRRDCIAAVRAVFGNPVIRVQVEADGNVVLLAFKSAPTTGELRALQARSEETKQRFGLEYPGFLRALGDLGKH